MNLTLNDYIESVNNPNGRFRTLEDIYPVTDGESNPVMFTEGELIIFRVIYADEEFLLICFLQPGPLQKARYLETATFTKLMGSRHIPPITYLEREMLVFDSWGRPHYADIAMKKIPKGETLESMIREKLDKDGDGFPAGRIISGIAELSTWLAANEFAHGRINGNTLLYGPDQTIILFDYTAATRKFPSDNILMLGIAAAAVYMAWCVPHMAGTILEELIKDSRGTGKLNKIKCISGIRDSIGDDAPVQLCSLLDLLSEVPLERADTARLPGLVAELGKCGRAEIPALVKMAENRKRVGEKLGLMVNGSQKYQFIGPMSDMMMRAFDGRSWTYLDKRGKPAIEGGFRDAQDFYEGRAVVETETGYGLIDCDGRFIIPPDYDDIDLDQSTNVLIVTKDGVSGLFSREGESITGLIYDQIINSYDGLYTVKRNRRYGYIKRDGTVVVEPVYEDAFGFRNGVGRVVLRGREYLIDAEGNSVAEFVEKKPEPEII